MPAQIMPCPLDLGSLGGKGYKVGETGVFFIESGQEGKALGQAFPEYLPSHGIPPVREGILLGETLNDGANIILAGMLIKKNLMGFEIGGFFADRGRNKGICI
jgi:hypothetical protein